MRHSGVFERMPVPGSTASRTNNTRRTLKRISDSSTSGSKKASIGHNHCDVSIFRKKTGSRDQSRFPRSARTAHDPSEPLGWAEIRHPFHPLRGQSFPVLKKRCIAGVDTLILRGLERGTFSVAREWTDWADPSPSLALSPRRWDADLLLDLANLLEQLSSQSSRELPKGD
jgi:hypothetical protein